MKYVVAIFLLISCKAVKIGSKEQVPSLRYLGSYIIPFRDSFQNTRVGGLSGIDYDSRNNEYYMISDDRSSFNPARYYTAKIYINKKIDSVRFTGVNHLRTPSGQLFPSYKTDQAHTIDPEAIRYNPEKNELLWTSEGERITGTNNILQNPGIYVIRSSGKTDSLPIPENLVMRSVEKGPRKNSVLEAVTFSDNFRSAYAALEEPLYEDGPAAGLEPSDAWIRIFKLDTGTGENVAQFAYKLEPVAYPPVPEDKFRINGVTDLLWISDKKFIVTERSFSMGRLPCTIRVFLCDLGQATNIKDYVSLKDRVDFVPATKTLLLNMDNLKLYTDNIEGATFGPILPNGHKSILFVSDNNFEPFQQSQLLLFEFK